MIADIPKQIVWIEWLDSRRGDGWVRVGELDAKIAHCCSVGWVIAEDFESVTLAGHLGDNPDQCCGEISIPKMCICQMVELATSPVKLNDSERELR